VFSVNVSACYKVGDTLPEEEGEESNVAAVDLGEIHPAVAHEGGQTYLANGRLLRSKRRYQNKLQGKLARLLARKKRGSRRWKRLIRSNRVSGTESLRLQLKKLHHQIQDILHKQTTRLVSTLHERGVQTVVIGDLRDIRMSANYNKKANQKIHQMLHGQVRHLITYKAERLGMRVVLQDERYSSQECPVCGQRNKPKGRVYRCGCGFEFHRDGVGAINIVATQR